MEKELPFQALAIFMTLALLLPLGIGVPEGRTALPPIEGPLVREGTFAMNLAEALNLGQPASEADAESMLGAAGVAPRNGWIADYPMTPDILGELRDSVGYAAQAKTIPMDQVTALEKLANVQADMNLLVVPGAAGPANNAPPEAEGATDYPDQAAINDYYADQGPPVTTYYAPPPDYSYLYAWVPCPFWWSGHWFGGFFVLRDFQKPFREGGHVASVSNHFNDAGAHRVFRVDPVNRYNGKTFAGIGAPRGNYFITTGVQRAPERIFNGSVGSSVANRSFTAPQNTRTAAPQAGATGTVRGPSVRGVRADNPFEASRVYSQPPGAGRTFTRAPSGGGARVGGAVRK
ncbi:MAG: hypothetical protein ABR903_07050 [Thermodesulfovibrionales bacterium]|jgi:hypothetical protein